MQVTGSRIIGLVCMKLACQWSVNRCASPDSSSEDGRMGAGLDLHIRAISDHFMTRVAPNSPLLFVKR